MISYWEQKSFLKYDYIIIGAGIVGLSAAIELKTKYPRKSILLLERGFMSSGASSRNAGFACMGSTTELLSDLRTSNEKEVLDLFAARKQGLTILRDRLGDKHIGYQTNGSYELLNKENESCIEQLPYLNKLLSNCCDGNAFEIANQYIKVFGFNKLHTTALIKNTQEGEIDTGKMLRALINMAISLSIEIKTGADVHRFEEEENRLIVYVNDNINNFQWPLTCTKLFLCTNAFTEQLLPINKIQPGRGQVLITKPIANLPFKGIFHFDDGYYYFRVIDNRILLGGGRNLDFATETTTQIGINEKIQAHLEHLLQHIILPNTPFVIAHKWSGIMAFGNDKKPVVKQFTDRVFGAFRMGGMGVALGSLSAKNLVALIED